MVVIIPAVAALAAVGVTEFEAPEAVLVPTAFVAVTVQVYAVPLIREPTAIGLAPPVAVIPPGLQVAV